MKTIISRRELLKLISLIPLGYLMRNQIGKKNRVKTNLNSKNVLIVVFDAWSAHNISLLGYPRDTTPNLNRLAEHAIVYHNHYSTAPWTIPGTASLLTGVYPWTNRAFNSSGMIDEFKKNNLTSDGMGPEVAVNEHAADPHFDPSTENFKIKKGDLILIDSWAKFNEKDSIYYDFTNTVKYTFLLILNL